MFIADFHIHSRYSRATSRECVPEMLELWARRKGLGLIGTGDFTHPAWREELKQKLVPSEDGLYTLKEGFCEADSIAGGSFTPRFIVSGEISSIYKKNGKVRKIHNLLLLPGLEAAEALSRRLEAIGNLHSDGRPILGLDSRDLLEIALDVVPEAVFIPAHIWTPHFSLFGAYSGFDDILECFGDLTGHIHALETGLSSDPSMNWRLSALDRFTLVSNSDAHSPANLAREANLFDTALSYPNISRALKNHGTDEFCGTIEFFPEEGKYHLDGHRNCKVCLKPSETKAALGVCPVCGGRITVGVLHRVEELADRGEGFVPAKAKRFESLVPLHEVIASSMGFSSKSAKVKEKYDGLIRSLGPELFILREAPLEDIERKAGPLLAEGIRRLRAGTVDIEPGYDGVYGKIKILDKSELGALCGQVCFFSQTKNRRRPALKEIPEKIEAARHTAPALKKDTLTTQTADPEKHDCAIPQTPVTFVDTGLNPEQWEAVSSSAPAVAVIAGPGTGKTMTLVRRIAYLIEKCGVPPSRITAVTFTNKAAGEMRARLERHFCNRRLLKSLTVGTFHSICLKMLQIGNNGITVIDEPNALTIIEDILKSLGLENPPRDVLKGISLIKNGASSVEETTDVPPGVYGLYCAQLKQYGVLDYDDILLNTLAYFNHEDPGKDKKILSSFTHLLVDEFQDINPVQYRLIKAWGKDSACIFVIGDPDQSIYGFRGSDPHCFQRFFEDFLPVRKVHLTRNYRSTPEIIRCARSILPKASEGKAFSLEAERKTGCKVRLLETEDAFSEALFVAREINSLVGGVDMLDAQALPASRAKMSDTGGLTGFSDIAVLYRTNRQAHALERCFLKEGIPYVVAGRDEFLTDPQVCHAVAFFRFLLNPQDLICLRLCLKKTDSLPAPLEQKVLENYSAAEKSIPSLADIVEQASGPFAPPQELIGMLRKYEPLVRKEKPRNLVGSWMDDNAPPEHACMQMLFNTSVMYEDMPSFLRNLTLGREGDVMRSGGKKYSPDAVSLMTLHGAKGLEFPVVFLCGVTEGKIPFRSRSGACNADEERRLFYVGMTRARDELILLTSPTPSPFLAGLPDEPLIKGNVPARRQAPVSKQFSFFDHL